MNFRRVWASRSMWSTAAEVAGVALGAIGWHGIYGPLMWLWLALVAFAVAAALELTAGSVGGLGNPSEQATWRGQDEAEADTDADA